MSALRITLLLALFSATGCTSTGNPELGETVTTTPGWSRLKQASSEALMDPNVWATLLSAVLLQADNLDEELSDQLREHTPIFGSTQKADDAGDDFESLTKLAYVSTALLAPGPETPGEWLPTKIKILGAEWLAVQTADSFTTEVKELTKRDRPDDSDDRSFPSSTTTTASVQAQMANLNVKYLPINKSSKQAMSFTFNSFAALTAWAKVEAGKHHPADVLAGWAVGHFIAHLAQGFIDPDQQQVMVSPLVKNGASGINLVFRF